MSSISAGTTSTTTLVHSGDTTGSLVFKTNDTGSGGTTAVTIDTSQNVGIGTTSPASDTANERILQVNAPTTFSTISLSTSRANTDGQSIGKLSFDVLNNTATYRSRAQITSQSSGSTANKYGGTLQFFTASDNTADASERMRIDSSGNLLVGTTSANGTEKFNVTSSSTEVAFFTNSSNTNAYSGIRSNIGSGGNNTTTWHFRGETRGVNNWYLYGNGTTSYSSDIRLKKNVQTARGYLEDLNKLRVVKYQWIGDNPDCQQVELGLIAQEVEEVFPNLIQEHEIEGVGDIKNIKQSVLPFMLLKAIQELKAINDQQAETINALTARVVALEGQ